MSVCYCVVSNYLYFRVCLFIRRHQIFVDFFSFIHDNSRSFTYIIMMFKVYYLQYLVSDIRILTL